MISSQYRGRAIGASLCATALAVLALVVVSEVAQAKPVRRPVKVMTRNLYLGADLTPAIVATTPLELALAGTQIWNTVEDTDFPERAKVLAYEIADADPDLIGLQEAAMRARGHRGAVRCRLQPGGGRYREHHDTRLRRPPHAARRDPRQEEQGRRR
jgi:hypothetical protein